jgi:AP-2 complex subunit beta-1
VSLGSFFFLLTVINQISRYATEIDMDFVRKSVRAIGKLAIKIEPAAKLCINTLLELVATKISYIVQEATVVIRNIFRKYPNQYESIIGTLCENLDSLDEPEAKAAMVWVIGQYADRIENSDQLLEDFLFTFGEESVDVQLALLTASVKLFLHRPKTAPIMMKTLEWVVKEADNPDLRDRGYMYWRLIAHVPQGEQGLAIAKRIVLGEKPSITAESERLDPATLEEMCLNVGTLATVYLKPVSQVFRSARPRRLVDSPALQRHSLPSYQARAQANEQRKSLALLNTQTQSGTQQPSSQFGTQFQEQMGMGGGDPMHIVSPQSFMSPNRADSYNNGVVNGGAAGLDAAMDAAELYFSGLGGSGSVGGNAALSNQMAQMQLADNPNYSPSSATFGGNGSVGPGSSFSNTGVSGGGPFSNVGSVGAGGSFPINNGSFANPGGINTSFGGTPGAGGLASTGPGGFTGNAQLQGEYTQSPSAMGPMGDGRTGYFAGQPYVQGGAPVQGQQQHPQQHNGGANGQHGDLLTF